MSIDSPPSPARQLPWEVIELIGVGLLAAATAIAIFSLVSGIVFGVGIVQQSTGPFGGPIEIGPSLAQIVQRSTSWGTPLLALLALGAIGAAWWEVEGWDSLVSEEESSTSEQDYESAFGHLLREADSDLCDSRPCCPHRCRYCVGYIDVCLGHRPTRRFRCVSRPCCPRCRHWHPAPRRRRRPCRLPTPKFGAEDVR